MQKLVVDCSGHGEEEPVPQVVPLTADEIAALSVVPLPALVSKLQLKLELNSRGLLDQIETAIVGGPKSLQIYWADTSEYHIDHPILQAFVAQMGFTQQLLHDVFIAAHARS